MKRITGNRIRLCRRCWAVAKSGERQCPNCGGEDFLKISRINAVAMFVNQVCQPDHRPAA